MGKKLTAMKKLFFTGLILCFNALVYAQPHAQLRLIAAGIGDSVVLRWAVANTDAWLAANQAGYIVERTTLDANNKIKGKLRQRIHHSGTIYPWPYASLEKRLRASDTLSLIAAQCLYGKSFRSITVSDDLIGAMREKQEEQEQRHGFALIAADLSPKAADLLGWRWVDHDIKPGYKYIYQVHCGLLEGKVMSDTAHFVIKPDDQIPPLPPQAPVSVWLEKTVSLHWKKQTNLSAWHIERSEDGKNFSRITRFPYMEWQQPEVNLKDSLAYVDSIGVNYKRFYYRLVGITPFGQYTPPSAVVVGMGIDQTAPPAPFGLRALNPAPGKVALSWEIPAPEEPLRGLVVARAPDISGPFELLHQGMLPADTRQFTDEKVWQFGANFYAVGLMDTAGNVGWAQQTYAVMTDFAPPMAPEGLKGSIDTTGKVRLHWPPGTDYDLKGYQVYFANQADHTFVPLLDSLLTDTVMEYQLPLNNLTEHIFFRIKAFDENWKESSFSEPLMLKKPDKTAPDAPVFEQYQVSETGIFLQWRPSVAADASRQRLLRRTPSTENWSEIIVLPMTADRFTDTTARAGEYWEYSLQTEDDAGLRSPTAFPLTLKMPVSGKKKTIRGLVAIWNREQKTAELSWNTEQTCAYVLVYRAVGEGPMEMIARVEANRYSDRRLTAPGLYRYAVKPFYPDGTESLLSEAVPLQKP
jgi:uncharacterized protein